MPSNLDAVILRRALQRVERQVQENLDQIRSVGGHGDVIRERMDQQLIVSSAGMNPEQFTEIAKDVVDPYPHVLVWILPEKTQVAARDLNAVGDLAGNAFETILDQFKVLALDLVYI